MLKVLFISHDSVPYGAPKSMLNIIDGLKEHVNFVALLPYKGGIVEELEYRGVKNAISRYFWDVYDLSSFKDYVMLPFRLTRHYISFFKTLQLIRRLHKDHKFDLIHSNSGVIRIGFYAAKFLKIPHIWHVREFQTKDYNLNILYGHKYFIRLLKCSERVVCVSESIQKYFDGVEGSVIYNGVMTVHLSEISYDKDDYFIFAGSLIPQKGIYDVLNAFVEFSKINKTTSLVICGTGNEKNNNRIKNIIDEAGLGNRIKLLGYRSDVLQLMKKAKAILVSSHYEAFGRITAEAMLLGCPVIGKASEGTLEIIKDRDYGFLYGNDEELVSSMIYVAEKKNYNEIAIKINKAKLRADGLFTQDQLAKNIMSVYKSVIKEYKKI